MSLLWTNMHKRSLESFDSKLFTEFDDETKPATFIRFNKIGVLCFETLIKPTETFMHLHCSSARPNATSRGIIKAEIIWYKNTSGPQRTKGLIF